MKLGKIGLIKKFMEEGGYPKVSMQELKDLSLEAREDLAKEVIKHYGLDEPDEEGKYDVN